MLEIYIPDGEWFNERDRTLIYVNEQTLHLEHSLYAIALWESQWEKPFLSKKPMSNDELMDYIRCMTIDADVDPMVYKQMSNKDIERVKEYIASSRTATTVSDYSDGTGTSDEFITSEVIYFWMFYYHIDISCEHWFFNRLMTLIKVCNAKMNPKKMSKKEIYDRQRSINQERRKALNARKG